jgi:hypothetical protein
MDPHRRFVPSRPCSLGWPLAGHQVFVDVREPDQLEEAAVVRSFVIIAVGRDRRVVHWSRTQQVSVKAVTVFQFEDVRHDWVVKKVSANVRRFDDTLNAVLRELLFGSNAGDHQQLGRFEDAAGDDGFLLRLYRNLLIIIAKSRQPQSWNRLR